ncbi:MAG TPA: hypothetical protein VK993_11445 [Chthoniobacterales bacterium]|nr:hypothetical protein [Chthoniobacterales bacterium]
MPQSKFTPAQAEELASAFAEEAVDYLFIGKSGAILLGYPDTTQDVDIFLPRSRENAARVLNGLRALGFELDPALTVSILAGSEIVLMKHGPFALDLIHAPDGIESFEAAKSRSVLEDGRFPVASLDDIIASKRAAGREKDASDVRRLEQFKEEFERRRRRIESTDPRSG